MPIYLKQSTAGQEVPLGYFVDDTDGNTEEAGLTIANTDIKLWKNGATTLANKNSGGATHISNGIYYAVLDATDTNTLGPMVIFCHPSGALPVRVECVVLAANIFDSMIGGGDVLDVSVTQISGAAVNTASAQLGVNVVQAAGTAWGSGAITAGSIATDAITAAKIAANAIGASELATDAVTEIQTGLATSAALATAQADLDILTGTDGVTLATSQPNYAPNTTTPPTAASIADAVWDEAVAGHVGAGSFGEEVQSHALSSEISALNDLSAAEVNAEVDTALADIHLDHLLAVDYDPASKPGTATALLNELVESDAGVSRFTANALEQAPGGGGDGSGFTAIPWNAAWDAEVQSEVTDALNAYDPPTKAELDSGLAALNDPTAAAIADAVWDEAKAGHVAAGSFGEEVQAHALSSEISALNNLSAAQVNAEVDSALQDIHLDHLFATDYDPASKPGTATALLNELVENDAGVSRFTANALEQGPDTDHTGTGTGLTAIPWNSAWDAEVQSEVTDGLNAYDPPTYDELLAFVQLMSRNDTSIKTDRASELSAINADEGSGAGDFDPATAALEGLDDIVNSNNSLLFGLGSTLGSPISFGSGASVAANLYDINTDVGTLVTNVGSPDDLGTGNSLADNLSDMAGGTFSGITDSLEAIRNHVGDGTNLTEAGGTGNHLTALPWNAAWDAEVQSEVTDALNAYDPPTKAELDSGLAALNDPTAASIADAVWDEAKVGHVAAGSFGEEVQAHALSSEISGLNNLSAAQVNAEVDSALQDIHLDHLFAADYDPASKPGTATALLNELVENDAGVSRFTANALEQGPDTDHTGTGTGLTAIPWNSAWDAEVQSEVTDGLNAYDPPTKAELDSGLAALNDLSAAQVNAEVSDVLKTDTISEMAQAAPPAAPTLEEAVMYLYMALRNKIDVTASLKEFHNDAGTVIWKKSLSDDGTTYSEAEGVTGP